MIAACQPTGVRRLLQMSSLNAGRGDSHYLKSRGEAEAVVKASGLDWTHLRALGDLRRRATACSRASARCCEAAAGAAAGLRADAKFAPVHVGDVVEAFARSLRRPRTRSARSTSCTGPRCSRSREIVAHERAAARLAPTGAAAARFRSAACRAWSAISCRASPSPPTTTARCRPTRSAASTACTGSASRRRACRDVLPDILGHARGQAGALARATGPCTDR